MLPTLVDINPAALLSPNLLWILLVIALLIFGFISVILIFHWVKYSLSPVKATLFGFVYIGISILIIVMAIVSLSYYQLVY